MECSKRNIYNCKKRLTGPIFWLQSKIVKIMLIGIEIMYLTCFIHFLDILTLFVPLTIFFEITLKRHKNWPKNGNFCLIFVFFFISTAWLQYLALKSNCRKNFWTFEITYRSGSVLIVKWENFNANGSGCIQTNESSM